MINNNNGTNNFFIFKFERSKTKAVNVIPIRKLIQSTSDGTLRIVYLNECHGCTELFPCIRGKKLSMGLQLVQLRINRKIDHHFIIAA